MHPIFNQPLLTFGTGDDREKVVRDKIENSDQYAGVVFGWDSLCQLASHLGRGWLYRGQSRSYALRPHVGRDEVRKNMKTGLPRPYRKDEERVLLTSFVRQSRPHIAVEPASELEWMAIARHHGLPTRLLDWSESFMAAAMFACKSSGINNKKLYNPEICVIKSVPEIDTDDPFAVRRVCLYRPPHITPRIPAQQGVFTVHPDPVRSLDKHRKLQRWLIAAKSAFHIKKMLAIAGTNESTINPTLDGLGEYLAWRFKWNI